VPSYNLPLGRHFWAVNATSPSMNFRRGRLINSFDKARVSDVLSQAQRVFPPKANKVNRAGEMDARSTMTVASLLMAVNDLLHSWTLSRP